MANLHPVPRTARHDVAPKHRWARWRCLERLAKTSFPDICTESGLEEGVAALLEDYAKTPDRYPGLPDVVSGIHRHAARRKSK